MDLEYRKFSTINLDDPFFDSLKSDYVEFEDWFKKKADSSAYIFANPDGSLDAFLYLKHEDSPINDIDPPLPAVPRLKVGTFKINAHGTKLGERFIKKIFDHAVISERNEIYLTVFQKHKGLIGLIEKYGFEPRGEKKTKNGTETVFFKSMEWRGKGLTKNYPLVPVGRTRQYLLSLYPEWHTRLLPDSILKNEDRSVVEDVSHTNSIHKVYLTKMKGVDALQRGDTLVIYRTSDGQGPAHYRSVATSVCVVEEVTNIANFATVDKFIEYCRPYSVFTEEELRRFFRTREYPVIVRFTYNLAFKKRVTRGTMLEELGMDGKKYWGFFELNKNEFNGILERGQVNESLIVDKT